MGEDVDVVQYGSDDTKTHRKIKHILQKAQLPTQIQKHIDKLN